MTKNPHLDDAVAIFTELGWDRAAYADAPTLPLGTPQQRKAALAGLRTGGQEDVSEAMLTLFAIRVGVTASRAASLLQPDMMTSDQSKAPDDVLAAVAGQRGPQFVQQLVDQMSRSELGAWWNYRALVRMVFAHDLPVPQRLPYLQAWVDVAHEVLFGGSVFFGEPPLGPDDEVLAATRFVEHVRAAVAIGVPCAAIGASDDNLAPFGRVLPAGVERGWLDRAQAVELVLSALDCATRPSDRRAWLRIWLDQLGVTDTEIVANADALVPVLASGESAVVACLVPALVAGVPDGLLADVVTTALCAPTKKARRTALTALAARPRPSDDTVEAIAPQLAALDDATLARSVAALVQAWGLAPVPVCPPEVVSQPFDEVWPAGAGAGPAVQSGEGLTVVDGFAVRYYWEHPRLGPEAPMASALVATALVGVTDRPADWTQLWVAVDRGRISAATARVAVRTVLDSGRVSPARLARLVEKNPQSLPVLWPVLTEPVRVAAADDPPPRWLNAVLDVAIHHAPTLREAARRNLLPPDAATWPGLADLAARPGKSAALTKARVLLSALDLEGSSGG
ncbi:MAG: hypothetical protein FWD11_07795 [Micrococcales bacterium]|nr:hypothetical protein [Micrococcales bacterium]